MTRTFIIAEAGINHNGDLATAHALIDAVQAAGADAVKFQTFRSELIVSRGAARASYQERNMEGVVESQLDMIRRYELTDADFAVLKAHCDEAGIMFLTTTADIPSTDATQRLLPVFKVGSSDIDNLPLLECMAGHRKPVILSSGMATIGEIEQAVRVFQRAGIAEHPVFPPITLLHCTTNYPCPPAEVNLRAMGALRAAFGLPVGYSDHTEGIEVPTAAVALGAVMIEKHFTLDRGMEGPDHRASLEPPMFAAMVHAIRNVERAMGDGVKAPTASERDIMTVARKSLVAARPIAAGERVTRDMLLVKRPGGGISPLLLDAVTGLTVRRDKDADELLTWEDFKDA